MSEASHGGGVAASTRYRHPLLMVLTGWLDLGSSPKRRGGWTDLGLALCGLLMSWGESPRLCDRFAEAHALAGASRACTYTGFSKALRRRGTLLVGRVRARLAAQLRDRCAWTTRGWCVFAVDGSKIDAPRTAANETGMGVTQRDRAGPQMLATVLVHLGSCVLWNWRIGRSHASERSHLRRLCRSTPRRSLLIADAGFVGFACLREVIGSGRHVLVRLAGNTRVITRLTDREDVVAIWPETEQRRAAPLLLRVIRVRDERGGEVVLGTSVLDPSRLSDGDAAAFYRMRWGVEVCYRSLKQTLDRRKMRSCAPTQAWLELHWSLLGLMALGVLAASKLGRRVRRWSVAEALRAVRRSVWARTRHAARRCISALRQAVLTDNRRRRKEARQWPHKKRQRRPGPPRTRLATTRERQRYAQFLASP